MEKKVSWCGSKPFDVNCFLRYLQPSLDKGHLTNDGPLQAVLQEKIKGILECKNEVLLFASGTAALHALVSSFAIRDNKPLLKWVTQVKKWIRHLNSCLIGSIKAISLH